MSNTLKIKQINDPANTMEEEVWKMYSFWKEQYRINSEQVGDVFVAANIVVKTMIEQLTTALINANILAYELEEVEG